MLLEQMITAGELKTTARNSHSPGGQRFKPRCYRAVFHLKTGKGGHHVPGSSWRLSHGILAAVCWYVCGCTCVQVHMYGAALHRYMGMWAHCAGACAPVHTCLWRPAVSPRCCSFGDIHFCCRLVFKAESLPGLGLAQDPPVSSSPALELQVCTPVSAFLRGFRALNSGSPAYIVGTLPAELLSQPPASA